jgi:hypothetical protein
MWALHSSGKMTRAAARRLWVPGLMEKNGPEVRVNGSRPRQRVVHELQMRGGKLRAEGLGPIAFLGTGTFSTVALYVVFNYTSIGEARYASKPRYSAAICCRSRPGTYVPS